ncbi:hypothetical protein Pla52o_23110 [Novipirellula galeiformis]|uniref:Uncharacterized protein n=1 Tax=Novipirellula galeiformis TaxID=2528004 RepID=A0A5C6CLR4_9BACT|nr:hypothetical protein Pla52o_23110 [Novipirellula galeiformis]
MDRGHIEKHGPHPAVPTPWDTCPDDSEQKRPLVA